MARAGGIGDAIHFGVYADIRLGPGANARAALATLETTARLAATAGLEALFVGEAHAADGRESDVAAPLLILAALAGRTPLRLGAGAVLGPLWNPLQLADHVALLERLSDTGFTLGVGLGQPRTLARYGVAWPAAAKRLEELIATLRLGWEQGLSWPPPRRPVDILVAGSVPASARRAARLGDGWFASSILPLGRLRELVGIYREEAAAAGRPHGRVACNRITVVAPTDNAAWRIASGSVSGVIGSYAAHGALRDASGAPVAPDFDLRQVASDRLLIGSPATVARLLSQHLEAGVTDFNFRVTPGGLPLRHAERTLELLATKVLPEVSRQAPAGVAGT